MFKSFSPLTDFGILRSGLEPLEGLKIDLCMKKRISISFRVFGNLKIFKAIKSFRVSGDY